MSNEHAECLRDQAGEVESLDTVETAIIGVTMRNAADEIDSLVLRLDSKQQEFDRLLARDTENLKRLIDAQSRLDRAEFLLSAAYNELPSVDSMVARQMNDFFLERSKPSVVERLPLK